MYTGIRSKIVVPGALTSKIQGLQKSRNCIARQQSPTDELTEASYFNKEKKK
jgi:hypothetical protein